MLLVGLFFSKADLNNRAVNLPYTDAHIAVSQYKNGQAMWFDQVPQSGDAVYFKSPQGERPIAFRVIQVYHYPSEFEVVNPTSGVAEGFSAVLLSPCLPV